MSIIKPQNLYDKTLQANERLKRIISLHTISDHKLPDYINQYFELRKSRLFHNELIPVSSSPLTILGEAPKGLLR
jgi:hypothetical protein